MLKTLKKKWYPGETVPGGVYWRRLWELTFIPDEGGTLPLKEGVVYHQVPILLLMVLGPIVGLAFILFLPIAVPVVLLHAAYRAIEWRLPVRMRKVSTVSPGHSQLR